MIQQGSNENIYRVGDVVFLSGREANPALSKKIFPKCLNDFIRLEGKIIEVNEVGNPSIIVKWTYTSDTYDDTFFIHDLPNSFSKSIDRENFQIDINPYRQPAKKGDQELGDVGTLFGADIVEVDGAGQCAPACLSVLVKQHCKDDKILEMFSTTQSTREAIVAKLSSNFKNYVKLIKLQIGEQNGIEEKEYLATMILPHTFFTYVELKVFADMIPTLLFEIFCKNEINQITKGHTFNKKTSTNKIPCRLLNANNHYQILQGGNLLYFEGTNTNICRCCNESIDTERLRNTHLLTCSANDDNIVNSENDIQSEEQLQTHQQPQQQSQQPQQLQHKPPQQQQPQQQSKPQGQPRNKKKKKPNVTEDNKKGPNKNCLYCDECIEISAAKQHFTFNHLDKLSTLIKDSSPIFDYKIIALQKKNKSGFYVNNTANFKLYHSQSQSEDTLNHGSQLDSSQISDIAQSLDMDVVNKQVNQITTDNTIEHRYNISKNINNSNETTKPIVDFKVAKKSDLINAATNLSHLLTIPLESIQNIVAKLNGTTVKQFMSSAKPALDNSHNIIMHLCTFDEEGLHGKQKLNADQINRIGNRAMMLFPVICCKRIRIKSSSKSSESKSKRISKSIHKEHVVLMDMFFGGHIQQLINECESNLEKKKNSTNKTQEISSFQRIQQCNDHIEDFSISKALGALTNPSPLPPSEETCKKIQELNPPNEQDDWAEEFRQFNSTTPGLERKDLRKACEDVRRSAAVDHMGISPWYIKSIFPKDTDEEEEQEEDFLPVNPDSSDTLQQVYIDLMNRFFGLNNSKPLHPEIMDNLRNGRSIPLPKKDNKIRPIGIGSSLLKVASKVLFNKYIRTTLDSEIGVDIFGSLQLGAGTRGGCEIMAKRLQETCLLSATQDDAPNEDNPLVIMSIDAKNAFNMIVRKIIFDELLKHYPLLVKPLLQLYGNDAILFMASVTSGDIFKIINSQGVIQGSNFSAFLFCLGLQKLIQEAAKEFSPIDGETFDLNKHLLEMVFFCDDGNCIGRLSTALKFLHFFKSKGKKYGYHIQPAKTAIFSYVDELNSEKLIEIAARSPELDFSVDELSKIDITNPNEGITIGGIPIGNRTWISEQITNKMHSVTDKTENILINPNTQARLVLLSYTASSLMTHIARNLPKNYFIEAAAIQNQQHRHILEECIGNGFMCDKSGNCPTMEQCKLPTSKGGLNLRSIDDIGDAAFVASYILIGTSHPTTLGQHLVDLLDIKPDPHFSNFHDDSHIPQFYNALSRILFSGRNTTTGEGVIDNLIVKFKLNITSKQFKTFSLLEILHILQTKNTVDICDIFDKMAKAENINPQKLLSNITYEVKYANLISSFRVNASMTKLEVTQNIARLHALGMAGSSTSLGVIPNAHNFKYENNKQFITFLQQRLGLNLEGYIPRTCPWCKRKCDKKGNHFNNCIQRPIQSQRHNGVVAALDKALPAGSDSSRELHGFNAQTSSRRPGDLCFNQQDGSGMIAAVDVIIVNPLVNEHLVLFCSNDARLAIEKVENKKIKNLNGSINESIHHYVPYAFTFYGGIGSKAKKHFQHLADAWGNKGKAHRNLIYNRLKNNTCFAVQYQQAMWQGKICSESFDQTVKLNDGQFNQYDYHERELFPITKSPSKQNKTLEFDTNSTYIGNNDNLDILSESCDETSLISSIDSNVLSNLHNSKRPKMQDGRQNACEFFDDPFPNLDSSGSQYETTQGKYCPTPDAFSESEVISLQNLFDKHQESTESMKNIFNTTFTREVMSCLKDGNMLKGDIIDFKMQSINQIGRDLTYGKLGEHNNYQLGISNQELLSPLPKVFFMNSFFYTHHFETNQYDYQNVAKWVKFDIFKYDKIVVPINIDNIHWTLVIIHTSADMLKIEYCDSCFDSDLSERNITCLNNLTQWIGDAYLNMYSELHMYREWNHVYRKDIPKQTNGYDCGMFICSYAETIAFDALPTFTQQDMVYLREQLALNIINYNLLHD